MTKLLFPLLLGVSLKNLIRKNRKLIEKEILSNNKGFLFSPIYYAQHKILVPIMQTYSSGLLLDAGCGDMPYRQYLLDKVIQYDSLDLYPKSDSVTFRDNVEDMKSIANESYNTVLCLEVLEHLPNPLDAIKEIYRVLKPGGIVILSVPHLSRIHDEPYDYFRYTHYGLRYLLGKVGFSIVQIKPRGSVLSFIGHQFSTIFLGLFWKIPIVKEIVWFINSWLITRLSYYLDILLDKDGLLPQAYVVVSQKPRKL